QQAPVPLLVKKSPGYANRSVALQRLRQNRPVYYKICNLDAAHTVSTPELWPGGASGLDLTGAGATIGLWDNGWPLPDHVELASRIIISDAGAATSDHATHVAGTIAASGIDGQAHGMAADAGILAYDWDNDLSELAQAASDGLVLANLSYSLAAGWELNLPNLPVNPQWAWLGDPAIDELEDWRFGFYTRESADLDQIACSAPYLLIVAAAGNDGNDGPLNDPEHWVFQIQDSDSVWVLSSAIRNGDGGYDCLPGGSAVAKNTLVVGSVNDLPEGYSDAATVTLMPLSSLGPTDDGRIKPDIVAGGSGLYSASGAGIDSYYSDSGTSMAAASVTGSLALLQQHYSQTHTGAQISAAAMKAIVIHTADDVGDMGPDYMTGWGLLNTANAADLISRDTLYPGTIIETALDDGYTYTRRVIAAGGEPLTVTLSWTDPPATVSDPALNPVTSMLVNDLNLHVTHAAGGATHYPFTLEPGQPDVPATSGINTRDNVEQVRITTPLTEEYLVAIDHSGPLQNGSQQFALTISGDNPQAWPAVLVWDGDSTAPDYSGGWIYDLFAGADSLNVTYMANMPLPDLSGFAAVFLSFGNYGDGNGSTPFDHAMVQQVIAYLESGGSLYLEGG
ncbi:MAG: S8 family serine peptidase, partial [Candidatus Marinimicrobia bacterium]|nr:S8 family serine peptidase [Candidatus Neomarinimicrobiota bacterium]